MLKNYSHTTVASTPATLVTAATGHEIAVVSLLASAGSEAGNLTITVNDGTSDVWSCILTLTANNAAFLDSKIFLPAAYILKAEGSVDGIKVMVSADDSEV
ncbi:MAG: hypothetical protein WCS56_03600 [Bacilli bacterium]